MTQEQIIDLDEATFKQGQILHAVAIELGADFEYVGNGYGSQALAIEACIESNRELAQLIL